MSEKTEHWHWWPSYAEPYGLMAGEHTQVIRAVDGVVYSEYSSDSATIEIRSEADALLIAAAPQMLAALRTVEAVMSIVRPRSDTAEYLAALDQVRAAIAKATSGS